VKISNSRYKFLIKKFKLNDSDYEYDIIWSYVYNFRVIEDWNSCDVRQESPKDQGKLYP